MGINFWLQALILLFLQKLFKCKCSIQQDCSDIYNPACIPKKAEGDNIETYIPDEPGVKEIIKQYCPMFVDKEICCRGKQFDSLKGNLDALDSIFGALGGGCDMCSINLKKFWCEFTCSPIQATFVKPRELTNHTVGKNDTRLLRDIDMELNSDMTCKLFQSCRKTKFVAQVPAMGNSLGFLNFQGVNAYTKIPVYINMSIAEKSSEGLNFNITPCNTEPENGKVEDYDAINCTCNSCQERCNYTLDSSTPVMEGLNWMTVFIVYLVAIIGTVIIYFVKAGFEPQ